jgi:Domain of unknown function (DUF4145)
MMAIAGGLWKVTFKIIPSWPCPSCQNSVIVLQKDSIHRLQTRRSITHQAEVHSEPTEIEERFSALMQCQNECCGQVVSIGGNVIHEEDHNDDLQILNWSVVFEPKLLLPAPKIFPIFDSCPDAVKIELERTFGLFWFDTGASANGLRSAIEALLNDLKIARTLINKKRKRDKLTLHARIQKLAIKNCEAAELLMAIKWLGNTGSHLADSAIPRDELLKGIDLFHGVIEMIYEKRAARLMKIAKTITKRKGRLPKKSGRVQTF